MSQPPNTTSARSARGTSSLMRGDRLSVRLPSRTVPIWVRLPIGREISLRIASTPAMKVVATAPIPGSRTPSLPLAGAISRPLPVVAIRCSSRRESPPPRKTGSLAHRGGGARTPAPAASGARRGRNSSVLVQELERGGRELAVVARPQEAALGDVVVENSGTREALLRLERVEHEDPAV